METVNSQEKSQSFSILKTEWNVLFVLYSKQHWDSLLRFCLSLTSDHSKAEDLLQNSLLKGLRFFPRFVGQHQKNRFSLEQGNSEVEDLFSTPEIQYHFKNWLYKITKNTYLDDKKNNKKWRFDSTEETLNSLAATAQHPSLFFLRPKKHLQSNHQIQDQNPASSLKEEEEDFYRLALDDEWQKKFEKLSEKQRSIVFLAAERYSYKEISDLLAIPMGTVMSTLSRALQKLKKKET